MAFRVAGYVLCILGSEKTTLGDGDEGGDVGGDDLEDEVIDFNVGGSVNPVRFFSECSTISTTRLSFPGYPVLCVMLNRFASSRPTRRIFKMGGLGSPFLTGGGLYTVTLLFMSVLLALEGMAMGSVNLRVLVITGVDGFRLFREESVDHSSSGSLSEVYAVTVRF